MYRRPKFLEILLEIRREMAHEADYDVDLFAEIVRSGSHTRMVTTHQTAAADLEKNGDPAYTQTRIFIRRSRKS